MNLFEKLIIVAILAGTVLCCRVSQKESPDKISIKGSETELFLIRRFADAYKTVNPATEISVNGGGSSVGIKALASEDADIANSSRLIKQEEGQVMKDKSISFSQVIIAVDAIAIICHPSVKLGFISLDELSKLYSGQITNWSQLGGSDLPVHICGRKPGSGTHDFMKHRMQLEAYAETISEFETQDELMQKVSEDASAIAYISSSYLKQKQNDKDKQVNVIPVILHNGTAIRPFDEQAINSGDYALIRPLFQYFVPSKPEVNRFIKFELSDQGQALLRLSGYYPINVFHKQINLHNGFM